MPNIAKIIVISGIILVLTGLLWPWVSRLPLGRLPGDFFVRKGSFSFYFPLTSCILLSLLVSVFIYFLRRH